MGVGRGRGSGSANVMHKLIDRTHSHSKNYECSMNAPPLITRGAKLRLSLCPLSAPLPLPPALHSHLAMKFVYENVAGV